jgi:hypothetical protein
MTASKLTSPLAVVFIGNPTAKTAVVSVAVLDNSLATLLTIDCRILGNTKGMLSPLVTGKTASSHDSGVGVASVVIW